MEKKNMVLLTVIAVATLLVAVVGATFAYFTATVDTTGNNTTTTVKTAQIASVSWVADTNKGASPVQYPGYMAYQAYTLSANGDDAAVSNYKLTLDATVDTELAGAVEYTVYSSETEPTYSSLFTAGTESNADNNYLISGAAFNGTGLTSVKTGVLTAGETSIVTSASINGGKKRYYVVVLNYKDTGADDQNTQMGKTFSAALKITALAS